MTAHGLDAPDVLEGGSWQADGRLTMRWVPAGRSTPIQRDDLHQLIACPTCRARVDETCRTTGGNPTTPHKSRLAPRLCRCGSRVARKKQMCQRCADVARQETYHLREIRVPTRARRRAA